MTDIAVMFDGTRTPVDEIPTGELLVLCQQGRVRRIEHYTAPRSRSVGTWRERPSKPLTESQRACVEGV